MFYVGKKADKDLPFHRIIIYVKKETPASTLQMKRPAGF